MNLLGSESEARAFCAAQCNDLAMQRFDTLIELLKAENERQNLVSAKSLSHIWVRHIADSLQLLAYVPRETNVWLDLGSGAGFPGLALAVARPQSAIRLVESRAKRVIWLEQAIEALRLEYCTVIGSRLEAVESFSAGVICARAFAPLDKLLSLSVRFSTPETVWLLPKGRSAAQDLEQQPARIRQMFHVEQSLTDAEAGILVGTGRPSVR